jgi:hypothetical protein
MASVRPLGDPSRTPSGLFASGLKRFDNRYDVEVDFKIGRKSGWLRSLAYPGGFSSSQVDFVNVFVQQTSRQAIPALEMIGKEISRYFKRGIQPRHPASTNSDFSVSTEFARGIRRVDCKDELSETLELKWKTLEFADV